MFSADGFALLRFLEGRWQGALPDGSPFYEAYTFPSPGEMRSARFADRTFETETDGSTVRLTAGQVVSTWGAFTWEASEIRSDGVCFEPVDAPSSFCWLRDDDGSVRVVQTWTDDAGIPQQNEMRLRRLERGRLEQDA